MKRKDNVFSDEQKLKFIHEWLNTDIGLKELKVKHGVGSNESLYKWMRKFGYSKPRDSTNAYTDMSKETLKTDSEKRLELKVRQLEKDLEFERLRSQALDKMIDIAERDLNIAIRKKAGTRQ